MDEEQSDYCYPGSHVLINKLDIRVFKDLQVAERRISADALLDLAVRPIHGNFDLDHLSNIHKKLFRDVYDWAGQPRTEDIAKNETLFAHHAHMVDYCQQMSTALHRDGYLRDCTDIKDFAQHAAHYLSGLNYVHPFREGNGRTEREFIRTLGLNAGFRLDWTTLDGARFNAACREAFPRDGDFGPETALATEIERYAINPEPRKDLQAFYDSLRSPPSLEWRGTLPEALLEAQRRAPGPVAFVSADWKEHSRILVQSTPQMIENAERLQAQLAPQARDMKVYAVREDGTIRNTVTERDEYLRVAPDASKYPPPLRESVARHFGQVPQAQPTRSQRDPEIPDL